MRLQASMLFLIAYPFTCAYSRAVQDTETSPGMTTLEADTHTIWTELASLLMPADKTQDTPFASNLLGIPFTTTNAGDVQPESQAPPNTPDERPVLLQQSLEALFFEETGKIIRSFETVVNSTVALVTAFHDVLDSTSSDRAPSTNASFTPLLTRAAKLLMIARDDFQAKFPLPAAAPGHAERVKCVSAALERLRRLAIRLARNHEVEQEVVERHLARVEPFLHDVGVLIGDLTELYPAVIEALVLNLSAVLLPEAVFLRSLVILYCFGPYVLGRDAISGWLLKHVSETLRL